MTSILKKLFIFTLALKSFFCLGINSVKCSHLLQKHRQSKIVLSKDNTNQDFKTNRYIIGFMRDKFGKIQTVYSESKTLESVRNFKHAFTLFGGWIQHRKFEIIPLTIVPIENLTLDQKSSDFDSLPSPLKTLFNENKILITARENQDMPSDYSLLMATAPIKSGMSEGRTGVLLYKNKPIIVNIEHKEFLVEIKGVGSAEGGFDYHYKRRDIRGGLLHSFAYSEYNAIEAQRVYNSNFRHGDTVRVAGYFTFKSEIGKQAYLIRLTPGTIRGSFRENMSLKLSKNTSLVLARKFGEIWGQFLSQGMIPLSHFENLVSLDFHKNFIMTDFSDIIPIGRFPFRDLNPERVTVNSLLALYELPEFKENVHFPEFRKGLSQALAESDQVKIDTINKIQSLDSIYTMADVLWSEFLVIKSYEQRKKYGWIPDYLNFVDLDHKDFHPNYFNTYPIQNLIRRHSSNENEIETLKISIEEKHLKLNQLKKELEWLENNQNAWLKQMLAKNKTFSKKQLEAQLIEKLAKIKGLIHNLAEAVESLTGRINEIQIKNSVLEGTNFTIQGALELAQSQDYLNALKAGGNHKFNNFNFGRNSQDLGLLKEFLKSEIDFLLQLRNRVHLDDLTEIDHNLNIANNRYQRLLEIGPVGFHQMVSQDRYILLKLYMLPYYSRFIDDSPIAMEQEQYKKYSNILTKLKSLGYLEE